MMRFLLLLSFVLVIAAVSARAEVSDQPEALTPQAISQFTLDELFEKLPVHAGSHAGRTIEREITRRFNDSGSATADLLMSWATEAIEAKNYSLALDALDQIVLLQPDFAEGWNKRATVHFILDDYGSSLEDIRQTLAMEPRHFGALAGLGFILEKIDEEEGAMRAFRQAIELNPQLDAVKESLERLEKKNEGRAI